MQHASKAKRYFVEYIHGSEKQRKQMSTDSKYIFKVVPRDAWQSACAAGVYTGSADDVRDGFIHFSLGEQLPGTLAKHYRGQNNLLLVRFEAAALGDALKWEPSRGGALFPHLYAPLATRHAVSVDELKLEGEIPALPEGLL